MNKLKNRIHSALNVIRRRYSLPEVPRRRIHNAIANAMSICVANKVVDTRLPLPVGSGDKYDVDSRVLSRLRPQCAPDAKGFLSDVYKRSTLAKKLPADGVQCGRSMIEMLGVLAIIGVLSVGGIAGYSKAMMNYKLNKSVAAHRDVIFGILEHFDNIFNSLRVNDITTMTESISLNDIIYSLNLMPAEWKWLRGGYIQDDLKNSIFFSFYKNNITYEIRMPANAIYSTTNGIVAQSQRYNFCVKTIEQLIYPMHNSIAEFSFYRTSGGWDAFAGDKECKSGRRCLNQLKIDEIINVCKSCANVKGQGCSIILRF